MAFLDSLFYFLIAAALWFGFLYLLHRLGRLEKPDEAGTTKWGLALMGPFLMWKTGKGRKLIDRIAQRARFWRWFGDLSIVLVGIAMVSMTVLLVWLAVLVVNIPPGREPSPDLLLGIPGINRLIPIGYGILALAFAIIVHEFCHGILARASKIKVNSLGLLLFIVPIGAFVEPDEAEMKAMPRRERARLFATGPAVNLVFALAFAVVFSVGFMGSVQPVADGVGVSEVRANSPAANISLRPGVILMSVNDTPTPSFATFSNALALTRANQTVNLMYTAKGFAAPVATNVTLANASHFSSTGVPGRGFLGVVVFPARLTSAYFHPIGGASEFGGILQSTLAYVSLPFTGLQPMEGLALDFYEVHGPLAGLGDGFWVLANTFYWLMWLNLMLGMTNALPAVPLDGGYLFRDGLHALLQRVRGPAPATDRERAVKNISYVFALMILVLIVWQFVGPWLF